MASFKKQVGSMTLDLTNRLVEDIRPMMELISEYEAGIHRIETFRSNGYADWTVEDVLEVVRQRQTEPLLGAKLHQALTISNTYKPKTKPKPSKRVRTRSTSGASIARQQSIFNKMALRNPGTVFNHQRIQEIDTSIPRGSVWSYIRCLIKRGLVRQVNRGHYQLTGKEAPTIWKTVKFAQMKSRRLWSTKRMPQSLPIIR